MAKDHYHVTVLLFSSVFCQKLLDSARYSLVCHVLSPSVPRRSWKETDVVSASIVLNHAISFQSKDPSLNHCKHHCLTWRCIFSGLCGEGPEETLLEAKDMGPALVVVNVLSFSWLTKAKEARADFILCNLDFTWKNRTPWKGNCQKTCKVMGDGSKPDVAIECVRADHSVQESVYAPDSGGALVLLGLGWEMAPLPLVDPIAGRGVSKVCFHSAEPG